MSRSLDLTGQRFGRLIALRIVGRDSQRNVLWCCRCDCGQEIVTRASSLRYGKTRSCGCLRLERAVQAARRHGLSVDKSGRTPRLYRIWRNMKQRCMNPKAAKYHLYGGRGITVCDEWMEYEHFHRWAMANGYRDGLTLDRIDSNGPYSPENCRWVTYSEQARNSRQNHLITYRGVTRPLIEWAERLGISPSTLRARLVQYGWPVAKALETPVSRRRYHEAHQAIA